MRRGTMGLCLGLAASAVALAPGVPRAQGGGPSLELIDSDVLRVCADPRNMPLSNERGEGYENRIAELLAARLGKRLAYTWYPGATGFVRNTLGAHRCDLVMGVPQGDDLVQATNPYYRTAYALVFRPDHGFDGIATLSDPRLGGKRIGIVAGTPPATVMAINGLMGRARPYPLMVDTRFDSSIVAMIGDITAGEIDAGVLWGPMAGYFAQRQTPPLTVVPLLAESTGPRLAYRISMGVRAGDQEWKRELNRLIRDNQAAITRILLAYGVPLIDEQGRAVPAGAATK